MYRCVPPECTDQIADRWSSQGLVRKVVLEGDDHACTSALPHILAAVKAMLRHKPERN